MEREDVDRNNSDSKSHTSLHVPLPKYKIGKSCYSLRTLEPYALASQGYTPAVLLSPFQRLIIHRERYL